MDRKSSEALKAAAHNGASISIARQIMEDANARGLFHAHLVGPKEIYRGEYIGMREQYSNFIMLGDDLRAAAIQAAMREMEEVKWDNEFKNIVTTVGKNLALDTFLAGSGYTVVGPYMGLINTNASSAVAGDTMASHAGWLEVGGTNAPQYTAPRKTISWSAASGGSKAASAAASFAITSGGTVGGCFLVFGTGALSTIDNTAGTLYSAGAFTGGSKTVANGDTLNVTYTASL